MPALKNQRHERFCRAYVRGKTAGNAAASYAAAGYRPGRENAAALLRRNHISSRVAELQQQVQAAEVEANARALEKYQVNAERVIGELARIGFANMLDYVRPTEDGDVVVDLSALDRDRAAAIQEVVVDTYQEGRGDDARDVKRVRFRLADKRAALVDLGKYLGLFVERREVKVEHADRSNDELIARLAEIDRQIAELGLSVGADIGEGADRNASPPPPRAH